jgi:glycolate oxidase FAD binding subunit
MLAFEPPRFGRTARSAAPSAGLLRSAARGGGSARDFVLGVRVLDAAGRDLSFGGQVMKNVAGYDVSRLVAGASARSALITEVSLKVLPVPDRDALVFDMNEAEAIEAVNKWAGQPLPISASCWRRACCSCGCPARRLRSSRGGADGR